MRKHISKILALLILLAAAPALTACIIEDHGGHHWHHW